MGEIQIADIFLYMVTIVGCVGLTACMMEFKYSKLIQILVCIAVCIVSLIVTILAKLFIIQAGTYYSVVAFVDLIVSLVALIVLSKDGILKTIFAALTMLDGLMVICYVAYMIASLIDQNVWVELVVRIAAFACIYTIYKMGLRKKFRVFAESYNSTKGWLLLISIPVAIFAVEYCVLLYPTVIYKRANYMHLIMIMTIIAMTLTYSTLFYIFGGIVEAEKLKTETEKINTKVNYWKQQIALQETIVDKAKQARHDLRHHDIVLTQFLKDKQIDKALDYLKVHVGELDDFKSLNYCQNYTVNCLLCSYIAVAEKNGIEVTCEANIPNDLQIDDVELAGAMANLIENATEGCLKIVNPEIKKYIHITTQYQTGCLRISVINSSIDNLEFVNGFPVSTKETKSGIGTKSVASIAEKYNGMVDYSQHAGVFTARVVLNLEV